MGCGASKAPGVEAAAPLTGPVSKDGVSPAAKAAPAPAPAPEPAKPAKPAKPAVSGPTLLRLASRGESVGSAVNDGAPVEHVREDGFSALHLACARGDLENVKALLAAKAPIDATNNSGWTPLHWAAKNGHAEVVDVLMAAGAEIGAVTDDGRTAVQLTLDGDVMKLLGPHTKKRLPSSRPPIRLRLRKKLQRSRAMQSAAATVELCTAAVNGNTDAVTSVLARGASPSEARASDGFTPLILAACGGHVSVVDALINAGSAVDATNSFGWTALHWASRNGHAEVVQLLINGGSKALNTPDGRTPMQLTYDSDVIRILADVVPPGGFK
ncbi:hypothetical protein NFJ02_17g28390 [Pycnococcus provasolii]